MTDRKSRPDQPLSRRAILKGSLVTTTALGALTIGKAGPMHFISEAYATAPQLKAGEKAIGNFPSKTSGSTITSGSTCRSPAPMPTRARTSSRRTSSPSSISTARATAA